MQPISSCSCELGDRHWGRSGWHFRFAAVGDLPQSMTHRWDEDLRRQVPIGDELIDALSARYREQWFAVERCPHYWKAAGDESLY